MKLSRSIKVAAVALAAAVFSSQAAFAGVTITGTGASFVTPLLNTCKMAWQSSTDNTVSYSGGGSGAGRANTNNGIGDFNFSDAPYTPEKDSVLHLAVAAAPISVMYNQKGFDGQLYLSPATISDIFAGKITKWNDAKIKADNAGSKAIVTYKKDAKGKVVKVKGKPVVLSSTPAKAAGTDLPDEEIRVVFRSDSSGTTENFVNYLYGQFPSTWTKKSGGTFANLYPGSSLPLSWLSASGSAGVAALANRTPYSISYNESSYAGALGKSAILNGAGQYVLPSAGGTATFLGAASVSSKGVLTYNYKAKDSGAYPLGVVSYALVDSARKGEEAKAVTSYLKYLLTEKCTSTRPELEYATITGKLLTTVNGLIAKLDQ
jgi:phosphate transport system substrate-binding protein